MRRRIRLTGRKQLQRSYVDVQVLAVGTRKIVALALADQHAFEKFPADARIKLRLFENKFAKTLEFGTLGSPKTTADLGNTVFSAPSCQLRVVASCEENRGLLLGSTNTWTLRTDTEEPGEGADEGILLFQPFNIAPRTWKLDIREDDYPVVYVDEKISNSRTWVRNDPVFVSSVLPSIMGVAHLYLAGPTLFSGRRWAMEGRRNPSMVSQRPK